MALCDRSNTEQTVDYPNIFALGDIADINEEKLAQVRCPSLLPRKHNQHGGVRSQEYVYGFELQNAEKHADVVAKNIGVMESTCPFAAMYSYTPGTRVLIISLGPKRCNSVLHAPQPPPTKMPEALPV